MKIAESRSPLASRLMICLCLVAALGQKFKHATERAVLLFAWYRWRSTKRSPRDHPPSSITTRRQKTLHLKTQEKVRNQTIVPILCENCEKWHDPPPPPGPGGRCALTDLMLYLLGPLACEIMTESGLTWFRFSHAEKASETTK